MTRTTSVVKFAQGALDKQKLLDFSPTSVNVGASASSAAQTSDNED